MKYFSMFSGIGGFELGIQRAYDYQSPRSSEETRQAEPDKNMRQVRQRQTIQKVSRRVGRVGDADSSVLLHTGGRTAPSCVGYSEIDKYATKVYERRFYGHTNYGDATKINPKQLPDFDLLVGGFPCQAFSIAGKRKGFDDTRGTLFFDIARICAEKRPRHLVLENVKGLLSHDTGKTFQTILGVLADLGYRVEWQVFNSKDFGVPQNRERIYIVGHLGACCGRQVFPIRESNGKVGISPKRLAHNDKFRRYNQTYDPSGSIEALDTSGGGGHQPNVPELHCESCVCHLTGAVYNPNPEATDDHCETCTCNKRGIDLSTKNPKTTKNARALQARYGKGSSTRSAETTGVLERTRIRRLTPRECERLQGFPDDWTLEGVEPQTLPNGELAGKKVLMSDTQRYKMCGNAVTVNVVEAVISKLYEASINATTS